MLIFKDTYDLLPKIPEKYHAYMSTHCSCGGQIERTPTLTKARCSNVYCPITLSYQADAIGKHQGLKGVGPKTFLNSLTSAYVTSPIELYFLLTAKRLQLKRWEVAKFLFLEGYDTSLEELYRQNKGEIPDELYLYKERILAAETLCDIIEDIEIADLQLDICLSGNPPAYITVGDKEYSIGTKGNYMNIIHNLVGDTFYVRLLSTATKASIVVLDSINSRTTKSMKAFSRRDNGEAVIIGTYSDVLNLLVKAKEGKVAESN